MDQFNGSDHELPDALLDDEDKATLAAIAQGMRDVEEGRLVPAEEVRKLVARWNSEFS
jgi:predicted transcriptional regulator